MAATTGSEIFAKRRRAAVARGRVTHVDASRHLRASSGLEAAKLQDPSSPKCPNGTASDGSPISMGGIFEPRSVLLRGLLGAVLCEVEVAIALQDDVVTTSVTLDKPMLLGPYEWQFQLTGIARGPRDGIVGATGLVPISSFETPLQGWWFVVNCAGLAIFAVLSANLGAITKGPDAYVDRVLDGLGSAASEVAGSINRESGKGVTRDANKPSSHLKAPAGKDARDRRGDDDPPSACL